MNIFKEILARILALWAISCFVVTLLVFFLPIWISGLWSEPKSTDKLLRITRFWMKIYFVLIGMRLRVKGKEKFKKGISYIVVCNHNSMMDVPITSPGIPGINKTIAKIEMSHIPIFGIIYKMGSVLLDRKNEESRKGSYGRMKEVLEMGMHMCIYPEGTRNKTDQPLQSFHSGAFRLALESGSPILPAVILNTKKVFPANKFFYYWPAKVEMHFLEPVAAGLQTSEQLKEKVFKTMWNFIEKHQN